MMWLCRIKKLQNESSLELKGAKVKCMDRMTEDSARRLDYSCEWQYDCKKYDESYFRDTGKCHCWKSG